MKVGRAAAAAALARKRRRLILVWKGEFFMLVAVLLLIVSPAKYSRQLEIWLGGHIAKLESATAALDPPQALPYGQSRRMKFFRVTVLALALLLAGPAAHAMTIDAILVVVGDSIITLWQVEFPVYELRQHNPGMDQSQIDRAKQDQIKYLMNSQIILHEFNTMEKARGTNLIPESIIEESIQDDIKQHGVGRADFIRQLAQEGRTYEDYKKERHEEFILGEMRGAFVPEPVISPHQIEVYYQSNQVAYKLEDRVKMRTIILKKSADNADVIRKRAEEIVSQIKGGATFKEMADTYSEPRPSSSEPEWLELSQIEKPLARELAKLKPGESSGVVEMPTYDCILLLQERDLGHVRPLSEMREEIEKILKERERNRLYDRWINRLKSKTFIEER
jgi:peptidyl-prolyl cis-trans isomerase SurA